MNRFDTIIKEKKNVVMVLVLGFALFFSGLLAVRNSTSYMAAAAIAESTESTPKSAEPKTTVAPVIADSATIETPAETKPEKETGQAIKSGMASFYGPGFAGRQTANGERFNPAEMTAAHRTLPFGSRVRVTNTHNGQSVVVRINDRGPYAGNRVIDLSKGAARKIGMINRGTANVKLELLS